MLRRRLNDSLIVTEGPRGGSFSVDRTELLAEAVELRKEAIILSLTEGLLLGTLMWYVLFWQRAQTFAPVFGLAFAPFSPPILECSESFPLRSFRYNLGEMAAENYKSNSLGVTFSLLSAYAKPISDEQASGRIIHQQSVSVHRHQHLTSIDSYLAQASLYSYAVPHE